MNLMYNPSFIVFLQHMPDQSMLLLYPALSRSSTCSELSRSAGYKSKESGSQHANPPQASPAARVQAFHFEDFTFYLQNFKRFSTLLLGRTY